MDLLKHESRRLWSWLISDVRQKKMKSAAKSVLPRQLSQWEREITRWLISHGDAAEDAKTEYLRQLDCATVISECACGCASIDFAIDGRTSDVREMVPIADFVTSNNEHGMFVFVRGGLLTGVEVYQMAADHPCAALPDSSVLTPVIWTEAGHMVRIHKKA
jgi:hypothetical protein